MVRKRIDCLVAATVLSVYSTYAHGPIGGDNAFASARVDQSVSRISRTQSQVLIDSNRQVGARISEYYLNESFGLVPRIG